MKLIRIFSILLFLIVIPRISIAVTLSPADMTGLRSFDNGANVILLDFDAVKSGTEDRTIAHFDITGLSGAVPLTMLNIPIRNIDPDPPGGTFEVHSFVGDGVVSTDEWDSGTLFHTFTDIFNPDQISVDVTSLLQNAVDNGDQFLSFNFRGGSGADRYWLNGIVNLPDPTLEVTSSISVEIDIKPGSEPNSINPRSKGVIPVAILSTDNFDATQVDVLSVEFGPSGAKETHGQGHVEDVDGDGDPDMILHFKNRETGIECGDTEATLTGNTFDGEDFMGTDSIQTVGCKHKKHHKTKHHKKHKY